jgi:hypothetical protein
MRDVRRRDMVCGVFSFYVSEEGGEVFGRYGMRLPSGAVTLASSCMSDERRLTLALARRRMSASESVQLYAGFSLFAVYIFPLHMTFTIQNFFVGSLCL